MLSDINKVPSLMVALFLISSGMFVAVSSLDGSEWTASSSSPLGEEIDRCVGQKDLMEGMDEEAENYLKNPSLGEWDEDDEIANWTGQFASNVNYRIDGLLGEYASVRSQPFHDYARQEVDVEAGQTYYMEAWFRVPEGIDGTAIVRLDYEDVSGTTHGSEEIEIVEADGWQSIELTVTEEETGIGEMSLYAHRGEEPHPDVAVGAAWFSDQESPTDWPVVPDYVDLSINIEGEGTTDPSEGNHTYEYMEEVTVEAESADNWEFVNWTGDHHSGDEIITITMDDDKEITANFEEVEEAELVLQNWSVEPEVVDPGETVTIEGEVENIGGETGSDWIDLYVDDMEEEVEYEYVELGPGESITVTFLYDDTEDVGTYDVRVEFYQHFDDHWESEFEVFVTEFVLTIEIEGEGSTDPVEGDHTYLEGEEVTVTAQAADGWYFVWWTGDHTGTEEEINIVMDENKSLTAHFAEEGEAENYLENPSLGEWDEDDEIANWTGHFASYVNYRIDGLLGEYASVRSQPHYDYARQEVDVEADQTYQMEAWFRVPEGIDGTAIVRLDYEDVSGTTYGSEEIEIVEADGWQSIELTITEEETGTGEMSLYAHRGEEPHPDVAIGAAWFSDQPSPEDWPVPDEVDLTIDIEGEGSTDPEEGTHTYEYGEQVTIEAIPAEDWYFVEWTGDYTGTGEEIDITMDDDKEIKAWFDEIKDHDMILTIDVVGEGNTEPEEGTHTYEHGEQVTVEATPEYNWDFVEWTGDHPEGEQENDTITIVMNENKSITAHFEEVEEAENYLENPSLGEWDEDDEIAYWTGQFASNVNYRIDGLLGEYASVKETPHYDYARQEVDVEADQTYQMEAWFRVPEGIDGTAIVRLDYEDVSGTTHGSEEIQIVEADGWQSIELTVTEEETGTGEMSLYAHRDEEPHPDVAIGAAWFSDQPSPEDWPVPDEVDLTIDIEGEGSTDPEEGTHTYEYGEQVTIEAIPAEDWYFVEWTGDYTGTGEEIDITMDDDKEIKAWFDEIKDHDMTLTIDVVGEGNTEPEEGTHTYEHGEQVPVEATPEYNWDFVEWTGDHPEGEQENDTITIVMNENKSITAHFEEVEEAENYLKNPSLGEWDEDDEIAYWTGQFASNVNYRIDGLLGEYASVKETPHYDYARQEVDVEANQTYYMKAWFRVPEGINGTAIVRLDYEDVSGTPHGSEEIEIVEADGWQSIELKVTEEETGIGEMSLYAHRGEEPHPDVAIGAAWFSDQPAPEDWPITLHVDVDGNGMVDIDPDRDEYRRGTEVSLTAVPNEGWYFVNWTGDYESEDEEITIEMNESKEITANFEIHSYDLNIDVVGEGEVDVIPIWDEYFHGTNVTLTAEPEEGWSFVNWAGDYPEGEQYNDALTIVMDEDKSLTAHFEQLEEYTLTINIEGEGSTIPEEGTHSYYEGDEVTITAEPEEGWHFVEWTGAYEGTEKITTVTMDEDKSISANFEEISIEEYDLTIHIEGEGEVSIEPFEPDQYRFEEGTDIILIAEPEEGWHFVEWAGDHEGTSDELWITMDDDKEITVVFEEEDQEEGFLVDHIWFAVMIVVVALTLTVVIILVRKNRSEKVEEDQEKVFNELQGLEGEGSRDENIEEKDLDKDLEKKVEDILDEGHEEDG